MSKCMECDGTGAVKVTDWVDYGSTTVPMDSWETCPACLDKGLCPKCGKALDDDSRCVCGFYDKERLIEKIKSEGLAQQIVK